MLISNFEKNTILTFSTILRKKNMLTSTVEIENGAKRVKIYAGKVGRFNSVTIEVSTSIIVRTIG